MMDKKCRKCQRKNSEKSFLKKSKHSYVETQYGLARYVEPSQVIIHQDNYLFQQIQSNQTKIKSMEKQIKKLKNKLKKCEHTLHSQKQYIPPPFNSTNYKQSNLSSFSNHEASSKTQTINNSQRREIGRFIHFPDRQSVQSINFHELGTQQTKIKPSKSERSNLILKKFMSKESALQYSVDNQEDIGKYLPKLEDLTSKKSSLLLSKNYQEDSSNQKDILNCELDQLIIEEKNASNPIEKRALRKQISSISQKLAKLQKQYQ